MRGRSSRSRIPMVMVMVFLASIIWLMIDAAAVPRASAVVVQNSSDVVYKAVYNGWKMWHVYCYRCHGMNAIATTLGPSLIEPNEQFSRADFLKVVRSGNPDRGMPSWSKLLDNNQISDIQTYLKARSEKVLPPGRPDEVGPNNGRWIPPAGWRQPK
jgi:mono/diheme cytochrome c family protein